MVYKPVDSEGSVGGWSFEGAQKMGGGPPEIFWTLPANSKRVFGILSSKAQSIGTLVG